MSQKNYRKRLAISQSKGSDRDRPSGEGSNPDFPADS
jgi:hypothetical protein